MLFRSYCIAAIAAIAATSPLASAADQSSSSVRGTAVREDDAAAAASATKQHRALAGVKGKYLEQILEYAEDGFTIAGEPGVDRRLRELQGNSANSNGSGGKKLETGPKKMAAFETADGMIYVVEGLTLEDEESLFSGEEITLPEEATMDGQRINVNGKSVGRGSGLGFKKQGRKLATLTGDKTVVGVRVVTACGDTYGSTDAALRSHIFEDAVNLANQYKACSHDQLNIIKAADRTSTNTAVSNIVGGIVTVTINQCSVSECGANLDSPCNGQMTNQITAAINAAFGVSKPQDIADQ